MGISCRQFRFRRECLVIRPSAAEIAPQGHFPALRAQGATAPAEPRNDKLGSAFFPCHCEEGASPTWQSQAGSDESAGGFPVFRPVLRDCRALLRKARNDKSGNLPRPGRGAGWKAGHLHSPVESHRGMGKMRAFFFIFLHFPHTPRMRLHPAPKNRGWVTDFADQISR